MSDNDSQVFTLESKACVAIPSIIDNVSIQVDAFIGGSNITIAQLNSWQVGTEVALEAALSDLIELRVNGLCVACGELVAVGDQFGIRITALST